ncbi:hypothetical protein [Kitasatospora azatica]|nr:hypothetical protein [Kitasatospora azatica]
MRFAATVAPWRSLASLGAWEFDLVREVGSGDEPAADDAIEPTSAVSPE